VDFRGALPEGYRQGFYKTGELDENSTCSILEHIPTEFVKVGDGFHYFCLTFVFFGKCETRIVDNHKINKRKLTKL
jgi:hypothetical protein